MSTFTTLGRVVLALALLLSAPVVAWAGGGGIGGSPLESIFLTDCYKANDGNNDGRPFVLEVTDQFGTRQNIQLGDGRLVCVGSGPWLRQPGSGSPPLNPAFDPNSLVLNAAKCYEVVSPADRGPGPVGTVIDPFSTETTVLKRLKMLCVPASMSGPGQ
jgi:hypothetical protein